MEFVTERYNYWIIIVLMMGGLYILFESQNLIKRLVGLSIFQTSVIFFYVTLSKIADGTAPILIGSGHGDEEGHGAPAHGAAAGLPAPAHVEGTAEMAADLAGRSGHADHGDDAVSGDAPDSSHGADVTHAEATPDAAHASGADAASHDAVSHGAGHEIGDTVHAVTPDHVFEAVPHAPTHGVESLLYGHGGEPLHAAAGHIIYSNPLPHVLMLTAIVVGVATLSVGLAIVVRIREEYGSIEIDEIGDADIAKGVSESEERAA